MAKKQRVKSGDIFTTVGTMGAELLGLEPPSASAPTSFNKHFMYINKNDGLMAVGFRATYAAKKFLDILLGDDEVNLTRGNTGDEDTIVSSSGIRVRCTEIMEILNYKLSEKETEWQLPESGNGVSVASAMNFRNSSCIHQEKSTESSSTEPRVKAEKKEKTPKPSKEGLITIAQLAEELKIEPRDARVILRKMKIPKPGLGWCWARIEADDIKKLLEDNKDK